MSAPDSAASAAAEGTVSRPRPRLGTVVVTGLLLIVVAGIVAFLVGRSLRPHSFTATLLDPPRPAADFSLISTRTGEPVSLDELRGKVVLLYFGYTTCPDVCPATLGDFTRAFEILGSRTKDLRFLWVSVDPERDTPEKMEDYITHFDTEFLGLIPPSAEALAEVASAYGVHYERVDYGSKAGYLMDHTATVAVIDANGLWQAIIPFDATGEEIAADLREFLKERK